MITFTFRGKNSAEYGVYLENRAPEIVAERQMEFTEVPGRDGAIAQDFGGHKDATVEMNAYQVGDDQYRAARAWLQGSGDMVFSTDTAHAYAVTIAGAIEYRKLTRNSKVRTMQIPMRIAPYAKRLPEAAAFTVESGDTITNPGTAFSLPKIKISGTGDVSIMIGDQQIEIDGLEAGAPIIIDSQLMECMNADESELKNGMVSMDEFPRMKPGANAVSWTGEITEFKVEKPRWRDI